MVATQSHRLTLPESGGWHFAERVSVGKICTTLAPYVAFQIFQLPLPRCNKSTLARALSVDQHQLDWRGQQAHTGMCSFGVNVSRNTPN